MSEIISGLFLGGMEDAFNPVHSQGATVINVASEVPQTPYANRYVHISADDVPTERLSRFFTHAIEIIDNELAMGNKVLVHCFAGISRSATIVIAYLMWKNRWAFSKAYEYVKSKRPIVDPNFGFITQLYAYGQDVLRVE
jgi:protein-tyrosine phosphatase